MINRYREGDVVYIPEYDEIALVIGLYEEMWGNLYLSIAGQFYDADVSLEIIKIGEL